MRSTAATRSRCHGCWIPTRHGRPGARSPRTHTSPPACTHRLRAPAAPSIAATASTAQPLTKADGSSAPRARTSKQPRVARPQVLAAVEHARTSGRGVAQRQRPGVQAADRAVGAVGAERGVDPAQPREGPVEHRGIDPRSRTSIPTGIPMTSSTRHGPARRLSHGPGRSPPAASAVALARVRRPADDVDLRAARLQRLLAQDGLGPGVDRLRASVRRRSARPSPPSSARRRSASRAPR